MHDEAKQANVRYLVNRIALGKLVDKVLYEFMVHDVNGELTTKLQFNTELGEIKKFNAMGEDVTCKSVKCKAGGNSYPTITFYRDCGYDCLCYSEKSIHNGKSIEMNISVHIIACIIKVHLNHGKYDIESVTNHMNGDHKDCRLSNLEECSTKWNNIHGNIIGIIYKHYEKDSVYCDIVKKNIGANGKVSYCLTFPLSINDIKRFINKYKSFEDVIIHYNRSNSKCRIDSVVSGLINWLRQEKVIEQKLSV